MTSTNLGDLTIANGQSNSDSLDFRRWRGNANQIAIYPPGTLTGTVKVQISQDGTNWFDLQSDGADVTIPADGVVTITSVHFEYLRVQSDAAEGAERVFKVVGR